jgi:hypothetical protein
MTFTRDVHSAIDARRSCGNRRLADQKKLNAKSLAAIPLSHYGLTEERRGRAATTFSEATGAGRGNDGRCSRSAFVEEAPFPISAEAFQQS